MTLTEMLDLRRQVVAQLNQIEDMRRPVQSKLESLDEQLFDRFRKFAAVIEGETPKPVKVQSGLPWPAKAWPTPDDGSMKPLASAAAHVLSDLPPPLSPAGKKTEPGVLVGEIIAALREIGRPATRNEIFAHLTGKGVTIPGKDPKANLSAHLSYSDEIVRVGTGWTLRQKEIDERQTPAGAGA